ncbi:MAG: tetratricopeptide repeat protein, partial [Vampirovibrio sp.]|nr:tetratricopeptide repeat protein [Vampirovibrio sp.]
MNRYAFSSFWQIALAVCLAVTLSGVCNAGTYENGIAAYKKKDYMQAVALFQNSVKENSQIPERHFYLGLALTRGGRHQEARKAFENVLRLVPDNSKIAAKAKKNMAVITKQQMASAGSENKAFSVVSAATRREDNYLVYAISGGKVVHWDTTHMPLKVYIHDGRKVPGWKSPMKSYVRDAMRAWQSASRHRIRFAETKNPDSADIIVRWKQQLAHNKVGESPFQSLGNKIIRSDVTIATHHAQTGKPLPLPMIRTTAIHELGHALGIQGHSPYANDIMYYSVQPEQGTALTRRDTKTIQMLYKVEADIKNDASMSTTQVRSYYNLVQQAASLQKQGQIQKAISLYEEALALDSKDAKLHFVLGVLHQQLKHTNQAIRFYKSALVRDRNLNDAKGYLGGLLINEAVRYSKSNSRAQAKSKLSEAVRLLEEAASAPNAPAHTKQNLAIARKNLTLM